MKKIYILLLVVLFTYSAYATKEMRITQEETHIIAEEAKKRIEKAESLTAIELLEAELKQNRKERTSAEEDKQSIYKQAKDRMDLIDNYKEEKRARAEEIKREMKEYLGL